jgi:predicted AlkP superfamily pyrophosphatase or phosphodiesterase
MKRFARDRALMLIGAVVVGATLIDLVPRGSATDPAKPAPAPVPVVAAHPAPPPKVVPALPPAPPKRVVIISEDGLRPDVLSPELTPRHIQLIQEGARAKDAETIPESDTLPSHASMLSGVGAREHGLWWNSYQADRGYIHVPTIFSAAHAKGLSTAMFVGKPKLRHIAIPGTVDHYERPSYLCGGVAKRAGEYFDAKQPDLMFVHFSDPDEYGHSHGWMSKEYMHAVHDSDRCLATLLDAIDASGLADSTLVIVTADHGGHGKKHSDGHFAVDRDIPWIVRGPGVGHGVVLDETVETVDTAATTLAALGLPALPHMRGTARLTFTR